MSSGSEFHLKATKVIVSQCSWKGGYSWKGYIHPVDSTETVGLVTKMNSTEKEKKPIRGIGIFLFYGRVKLCGKSFGRDEWNSHGESRNSLLLFSCSDCESFFSVGTKSFCAGMKSFLTLTRQLWLF
uniref:Wound-responsive protein 9.11 n=1 Tax=Castanea sativa TaxID=21020 RepID=Q940E2_CASSA|nr:wound-responsive protein 9.11 [Castanea sativa]